jgi:glycosyltransferase involved in cell wall biosynthesis
MSQPILIATVMRPDGDTGVQTHFRAFAGYLVKQRQPVKLITPFDSPKWLVYPVFALRRLLDLVSGTASVWWYRHWHSVFLRLALQQNLSDDYSCVVYAQCPLSADAALRARASLNQRVVMVVHFNISQADEWSGKCLIANGGLLYRSIQRFETDVLPKLDGLVFVSKFMQRELVTRIPAIAKIAMAVVPNFLPDPGLPVVQQSIADLICIGTLEARKNQQYLLDIIAALREQGSPLTLTIVGDGPDRLMLEDKARTLKIDDLVRFAGFVSNAAEQISQHRACIHVATIENLPVTLIEAMAYGRPFFAVPVGGIPEVLGAGTYGLALPLNDAPAAARIVIGAMKNPHWMAAAGLAARECFLRENMCDIVAKRLTLFLES